MTNIKHAKNLGSLLGFAECFGLTKAEIASLLTEAAQLFQEEADRETIEVETNDDEIIDPSFVVKDGDFILSDDEFDEADLDHGEYEEEDDDPPFEDEEDDTIVHVDEIADVNSVKLDATPIPLDTRYRDAWHWFAESGVSLFLVNDCWLARTFDEAGNNPLHNPCHKATTPFGAVRQAMVGRAKLKPASKPFDFGEGIEIEPDGLDDIWDLLGIGTLMRSAKHLVKSLEAKP